MRDKIFCGLHDYLNKGRFWCLHDYKHKGEKYDNHYWNSGYINGFRCRWYVYSERLLGCSKCGRVKYEKYTLVLPPFESVYGGNHYVNGVRIGRLEIERGNDGESFLP